MITFENISFGYRRGENVLTGFSMEIPDGDRICLFGKSGCGKSTVLRLAMGLSRPGSGRITGTEGLSISAVFQEDRLIPWKTVLENAALFASDPERTARTERTERIAAAAPEKADARGRIQGNQGNAQERAADYLCELGLGNVLHSLPAELSGGMKRRVALARALAHPFDFLVLDEPFTGLDEAAKRNAVSLVNREGKGKMLLLATHDLQEAEALQAKIIEL